jgi:hypothetical protein
MKPPQKTAPNRPICDELISRWKKLCESYLPLSYLGSIWRFSRESLPSDPEQGWKIHISATVLDAPSVLEAVGPLLQKSQVLYKAPKTLSELKTLNSGIHYGYCQIGKFITVYPRSKKEGRHLAVQLHRLTRKFSGPSIPFDLRFTPDSCVYYRYGAFKTIGFDGKTGLQSVIRNPNGQLVPDTRDSGPKPEWVSNLFTHAHVETDAEETPLKTTFKAFRALAQRGKGGVYQAVDFSVTPPRLAVLKEGRNQGELEWDGRDGSWRVEHEGHVLSSLRSEGINVPKIYSSFVADRNQYLALEFIEGGSFEEHLVGQRKRLKIITALQYCIEVARLIANIHRAGWVWRDCKPRNLILSKSGELRPIDFEGACRIDEPDPEPWGTPSYAPPEWDAEFSGQSRQPEDLHALGVTIFMLFTGRTPDMSGARIRRRWRSVPSGVVAIYQELLDSVPERRPNAHEVVRRLEAELRSLRTVRAPTLSIAPAGNGSAVVAGG